MSRPLQRVFTEARPDRIHRLHQKSIMLPGPIEQLELAQRARNQSAGRDAEEADGPVERAAQHGG